MSFLRFLTSKTGISSSSIAQSHTTASTSSSHGAVTGGHGSNHAVHNHSHGTHATPWEGVNLWRTPYKGDIDTVTHVKRSKSTLDRFVENRVRRIQELQLFALRNKSTPTWVLMPRDKLILAAEGVVALYVLYQVTTTVYNHLKAKDRLKLIKLLYKDNVD